MKKLITLFMSVMLCVAMLTMSGCALFYGQVEKAFTKEGYELVESGTVKGIQEDAMKAMFGDDVEVHVLTKEDGILNSSMVTIIEFKSKKAIIDYIEENKAEDEQRTSKEIYKEMVEDGQVNGKFILYSTSLSDEAIEIFKNI